MPGVSTRGALTVQLTAASSEHDMVAMFLKAEYESIRFSALVKEHMVGLGLEGHHLERPDLGDERQNLLRGLLLGAYRGWRTDRLLFEGFPCERVSWSRAEICAADLGAFYYAGHAEWRALSMGTCSPLVFAGRIRRGLVPECETENIAAIAARLQAGEGVPPIIVVGTPSGSLGVVVEGSARVTAFALASSPDKLGIIYGSCDLRRLMDWRWFPERRLPA